LKTSFRNAAHVAEATHTNAMFAADVADAYTAATSDMLPVRHGSNMQHFAGTARAFVVAGFLAVLAGRWHCPHPLFCCRVVRLLSTKHLLQGYTEFGVRGGGRLLNLRINKD